MKSYSGINYMPADKLQEDRGIMAFRPELTIDIGLLMECGVTFQPRSGVSSVLVTALIRRSTSDLPSLKVDILVESRWPLR